MIDEVIRHPSPIGNLLIYLSGLLSMGWSRRGQCPSFVDPRLARSDHHPLLAFRPRRYRAHRLTGHYPETRFNALWIATNPANRRCHFARAWWLSKL
jgi:hypothetical protein